MSGSRKFLATFGAVLVALTLTACGSDGRDDTSRTTSVDYRQALRSGNTLATRTESFGSLDQLAKASAFVGVVRATDRIVPDESADKYTPATNVTLVVQEAIGGEKFKLGEEISVFAEGSRRDDDTLDQDKFTPGKSYLVYLVHLKPNSKVYAVTGYLAGMYEEVAPKHFGRVDAESGDLPIGIDFTTGQLREIDQ